MDRRSSNVIKGRLAAAPALLAPTAVLLVVLLLFNDTLPVSLGPLRDRVSPNREVARQLLVLRPEPSAATGAPISNIWMIRSDGTGLRRITNVPDGIIEYTVDPNGAHVAYTAPDGPATTAIWVTDLEGGTPNRLTSASDPAAYASPAWSPVGDSILYVRRDLAPQRTLTGTAPITATPGIPAVAGAPKIFAMRPDGKQLGRVYGKGDEVGEAPVWSPDATHVALREVFPQRYQTTLVISDFTANPVKVPIGTSAHTAWSPDGQWLVYDELGGAGGGQIVLLRVDGTQRTVLFPGETHLDTAPAWSPDGQWLAFLRRAPGPPPPGAVAATVEVWSVSRDGRDGRRLFGGDQRASSEPLWSPDGRLLASTRYRVSGMPERGVWVVDADGARARQLLADATNPLWLP